MNDLEYQHKIDELNRRIRKLESNNSYWKIKYQNLLGKKISKNKPKKSQRRINAERFLRCWHKGNRALNFQQIADKCFLSRNYIAQISSEMGVK